MKSPMNHKTNTSLAFMFLCCLSFIVAQPALPIFTENASVIQGEEFCVDITVDDFVEVESFQFSLSWDSTHFEYVSTVATDVPDPFNFGYGENFVDSGVLTANWLADFNTGAATAPNGTSLFQVCFTAIGTPDTCSVLNFSNMPLGTEVVTVASMGMDIGIDPTLGNMCIVEQLEVQDTVITQANCGGNGGGAIDIGMNGGLAPYDFTWQGNGFSAMTEDISDLAPGMYYLTVTDASLPAHVATDSFEIANPLFSIAFAGVDTVLTCANPIITLNGTANPINNDVFVEWYTPDGNIMTDPFIPFIDVDASGTYCFTTLVGTSLCADTSCLFVDLNNTAPIADAGTGGELTCEQLSLTLDASGSSQGPNLTYTWTTSDGNIVSGASTQTPLVDTAGLYTLMVLDTLNGCPSSSASVLVTQDVELPMSFAGTDTLINCYFPEINLDGTGSTEVDVTYTWFTDDGNITGTQNTLTPSVNAAGTYGLIVTNTANCSDTSYVVVSSDMEEPFADAGDDQELQCSQFLVLLDGSASDSGDDISYVWTTTNGILVSGQNTAVAEAGQGGAYQLEVINAANGCSGFSTVMVGYDTIPPIVDIMDGPTLDCNINSAMLDASNSSTGSEFTYEWNTFDGNITSGAMTMTPTVNGGGVYVLLLQNTDNSCITTGTVIVTMDTIPPLADPGLDTTLQCEQPLMLDGSNSGQGSDVTYSWETSDGNIVSGQNTITPVVDMGGTYVLITQSADNGCSDTASVFVDGGVDLADPDVGMGFDICEDSTLLMGNLPMGTSGMWTSNSTATILMPDTMDTWVQNMEEGAHIFVWTLSTDECPDYDTDTLTIQVEGQPFAEEDMYTFFADLPVQELLITDNDDVSSMISWDVTLIDAPTEVVLTETANGVFEVTNPSEYVGVLEFEYALCSETCPDVCDTTLITLNIEEVVDTITQIANGITPNGDGKNDVFIIPEISMEPDKYPDNELLIYNRWGDVVYRAKPYLNDWRGTDKSGKDLPQGTYYYLMTLTVGNSYQGDVTILK